VAKHGWKWRVQPGRLAASELIKTFGEPAFEQYRSVDLAPLRFSKLTLGTVTPQFTGMLSYRTLEFFSFFLKKLSGASFLILLWCLFVSNIGKCLIFQEHILEIVREYYGCGLFQWIEIHVKQNIILGISIYQAMLVIHMFF
jgi:hypothetical protein